MKKPKIGYLLTPITFGGSEKVNLNFLKYVDRNKYDIIPIIIIRPWEDKTVFEKELLKMDYRYLRIPVSANQTFDLFRIVRCYLNCRSTIMQESIDLLHTHGYLADIYGLIIAKSLNIPIISTCHGFIFRNFKLRLYFKLNIIALRYFDSIIAVSNTIKSFLVQNNIVPSIVEVVPNAVDTLIYNSRGESSRINKINVYRRSNDELILGYIGRMSKEKGVKYLIEAFSYLRNNNLKARLLVIGEGPELEKSKQLAEEMKIADDILFLGFQDDIMTLLQNIDIFILPSLTEGTPLAVLEAMSVGVPVIATRVGGVPDIIEDGLNGILVNPGDHAQLSEAIVKLHMDGSLKISIINNAYCLVEREYSMDAWINTNQNIYDKLLNNNR